MLEERSIQLSLDHHLPPASPTPPVLHLRWGSHLGPQGERGLAGLWTSPAHTSQSAAKSSFPPVAQCGDPKWDTVQRRL